MYFWECMYWSILYSRSGSNPSINRNKIWGGQIGGVLVYNGGKMLSFYGFCQPNYTPESWLSSCIRSRWEGDKTPILSLCQGIFTDWSIFRIPFLLWKKGSSGPVAQWRQLVSCDWSWHSHGSLIPGKFDLKINQSMKTPWQEYSGVACSSSAPGCIRLNQISVKLFLVVFLDAARTVIFLACHLLKLENASLSIAKKKLKMSSSPWVGAFISKTGACSSLFAD